MGAPYFNSQESTSTLTDTSDRPSSIGVEGTYTSLIQQYLSVFCVDNATFFAERLVATSRTNHSLHLLAICYFRDQKPQRAIAILEQAKAPTPCMQYLLAKCHYALEAFGPAEEALLRQCRLDFRKQGSGQEDMSHFILASSPCPIPNGAVGLHLLGSICINSNRKQRAIQYYRMALQLDPMMWTSFEALCELGVDGTVLDPITTFGVNPPALNLAQPQHRHERGPLTPSFSYSPPNGKSVLQTMDATTPSVSSLIPSTSLFPLSTNFGGRGESTAPRVMFTTPDMTPISKKTDNSFEAMGSNVPDSATCIQSSAVESTLQHVVRRARSVVSRRYYEPSPEFTPIDSNASKAQPRSLFLGGIDTTNLPSANQRSFSTIVPEDSAVTTPLPLQDERGFVNTARKPRALFSVGGESQSSTPQVANQRDYGQVEIPAVEDELEVVGVQQILELLCVMGSAQLCLGQFRSKEAIELFNKLPDNHFHSGYVMHQVGRAYFEMADYQNSIRYLQLMEQLEPHRMQGLEVLSTALWQMKREVELSYLAQRVTDFDRLSAEVWCVVGNCFSLQKEHETALTFFRRSIQLDPSFTYSHTLSGHEYFANEDFEKAIACYRDAIRADERHYNAWYGLGAIYHCQEKFDLAEYHFQKASSINPQSSVLICHLGMAQNANGKAYAALDTLRAAFRIDPRNPQAHYQRALVYQSLERPQEALAELEKVRDAAPREAQIHFAMGRLYKRMGRTDKAMRCFLNALDLDPKDTNLIKAAMEKMDEPDIEEEISAF